MRQHPARKELDQARTTLPSGIDSVLVEAVQELRAGVDIDESFRDLEMWVCPRLLGYFQGRRFSREDAEHLVHETLTRVYLGIRQIEQEH